MDPRTLNLATFPLASEEEAVAFELQLGAYVKQRTGHDSLSHYSLTNARRSLVHSPDGGRTFAALVDLRLSIALLELDVLALGRLLNSSIPFTDCSLPAVGHERAFEIRMDIHDHSNSFVLRFRSIWDKIMGLLVLHFQPTRYDWFSSSKSKKAAFRKIFQSHEIIPEEFVRRAGEIIQSFDDGLRTPEAHGTGVLRKSSFTWANVRDSPPMTLLGYWNFFNEVAHVVGALFDQEVAQARVNEARTGHAANNSVKTTP